jgi:uncharacterized protein (UPF0179 family)
LNDLTSELQSIEIGSEANKYEIKRIKNKIQQDTITEGERSKYEVLRVANKTLAARKKAIASLIASLEKK